MKFRDPDTARSLSLSTFHAIWLRSGILEVGPGVVRMVEYQLKRNDNEDTEAPNSPGGISCLCCSSVLSVAYESVAVPTVRSYFINSIELWKLNITLGIFVGNVPWCWFVKLKWVLVVEVDCYTLYKKGCSRRLGTQVNEKLTRHVSMWHLLIF